MIPTTNRTAGIVNNFLIVNPPLLAARMGDFQGAFIIKSRWYTSVPPPFR